MQVRTWKGVDRKKISALVVERNELRHQMLMAELAGIIKPDERGLRTRINVAFDEWTDRTGRSWMAIFVTYCNKEGKFCRRLLSMTAVVGAERQKRVEKA